MRTFTLLTMDRTVNWASIQGAMPENGMANEMNDTNEEQQEDGVSGIFYDPNF